MAIKVVMIRDKDSSQCNAQEDCWIGEDGAWAFRIWIPKHLPLTTADVYFEFEDEEKTEP